MLYIGIYACFIIMAMFYYKRTHNELTLLQNDGKWILLMSTVALFIVFYDCIFGGWKLSFSNMMYNFAPFKSLGTGTKGPLLSDVIDAELPDLFERISSHKFLSLWSSSNGFGYEYNKWEWLDLKKLAYLFGLEYGQAIQYILKYILAGLGMYLYLRKINLTALSSFVGGIIFAFSSVMVVWHGWPHTDVTAYAPFLFYFVEDLLRRYKKDRTYGLNDLILFSVVLFFMLITGMPTYVPFFLYLGIIYTIFRMSCLFNVEKDKKFVIAAFAGLGIATLLAGFMSFIYTGGLLNSISEYAESRQSQSFAILGTDYLRTLIAPYFRSGLSMHINESTLFSGFIFLFTVPVYLLCRHSLKRDTTRLVYFWGAALIVVALFIFYDKTGLIYQFIPLLNTSSKRRIIVLFNFSAAVLSALCFEIACKSESKINFSHSFALYIIPAVALWLYGDLNNEDIDSAIAVLVLFAVCIQIILLKKSKPIMVLLSFAIMVQMSFFAKEYIPLIPEDAEVIPEATESVQYLIENANNGERVGAIGTWTMFPNANKFYGLTDIRYHGFMNTVKDIRTYLTGIDSSTYNTPTRTELNKIDNENLLKYASVHYLLSQRGNDLSRLNALIQTAGTQRTPYAYYGEDIISQYFKSETGFDSISLLLSTYSKTLSENDFLTVTISDSAGNSFASETIRLDSLLDNRFITITLKDIAPGGEYIMRLQGDARFDMPLALWITGERIYDGDLLIGDTPQPGSVSFVINSVYTSSGTAIGFDDNMIIEILEDSSPRAFLADAVIIKNTDEEVLNEMKSEYKANAVFITKDYENELLTGTDYPTSEVLEYVDNGEKVTVSVDGAKGEILVLTDYFTNSWKVYVDGNQAECLKVNYLFRGVVLPEDGVHTITFVYENTFFTITVIVSIIGAVFLLIVIFMKKKVQEFVERKIAFSAESTKPYRPKRWTGTKHRTEEKEHETDHPDTLL